MSERTKYFIMQKGIGLFQLIFTLVFFLLFGDLTIGLFLIPLGLTLMCTKKMMITTRYYYENGGREQWD